MAVNREKRHITIHDIARELGISASTVSRALSDNPRISLATRKLVQKLALENGYRPNTMASNLRKGKGNTVGVIVPNISRSFFSNVISGMEKELSSAGFNLMICQSHESIEKEREAISTLLDARVDGIMMSLSMESSDPVHIRQLVDAGVRLVFFDRIPRGQNVSRVVINDYIAAFNLTKYLISQGYSRIAHVAGYKGISVYDDRRQGYEDAMRKNGMDIPGHFIAETEMTREGGAKAFDRFFSGSVAPDAVVSAGDYSAHGVFLEAQKNGLNVPVDLAISGFSNEEFTQHIDPPITTVDQRGYDVGCKSARLFLDTLETDQVSEIVLDPNIIYRESTVRKLYINN